MPPPRPPAVARAETAFTLVEVLVSTAVLLLILLAVTLLFNGALVAIGLNNKHTDADAQARIVFDRMAVDFAQMVRRPDVDYFLKDDNTPQTGNDQLAFYSQVPGYYLSSTTGGTGTAAPTPAPGTESPVSLVAYRVNSDSTTAAYSKLQRLGYGLFWNGVSTSVPSVVFSAASTTVLPNTISTNWAAATNMAVDSHYELASAQVFRFEYSYILRGQILPNGQPEASQPSIVPWDTNMNHTAVAGLQDVSAFVITIALTDPRTRLLTTDAQLAALASKMPDDSPMLAPGKLQTEWENAVSTSGISRAVTAGIRVYRRFFYLPQNPTP
jgi:hypothetical protein